MAQFLKDNHSANVHQNIVRRCLRLCRQVKNADEFATALEPFFDDFKAKRAALIAARENTENLYDSKVLADTNLGDKLQDLSEDCKKYDRNNPGSELLPLLFPNGVSRIMAVSYDNEPAEVEKIILKINDLGAEHPIAAHVPVLQESVNTCKAAIDANNTAKNAFDQAKTLLNIAKGNLNKQYEKTIYAASGKFGKKYAERLFPAIKKATKKSDDEAEEAAE